MDNSAVRNKWMDREALENYRHAMRICCMNALHVCSGEALSELCYDLDISRNGDARAYEHLLGGQCMVITSEPGGGKSYLMWLLLRDYLEVCRDDSGRLPVFLDGRDYGIVWDSIEKGIVRALSGHFPLVTEELVRERLNAGRFVLLADAVDAQSETGSFLLSELYCLGHDTDNTVIIASRMQCDRRDFHSDFVYYTIDPVSDEQIIRWLERDAASEMIGGDERNRRCEIRQMPGRLLEVLRTPLFIRMYAMTAVHSAVHSDDWTLLSNHTALLEAYIDMRMKAMSCSPENRDRIFAVLCEYAADSYVNGDSEERFLEIVDRICIHSGTSVDSAPLMLNEQSQDRYFGNWSENGDSENRLDGGNLWERSETCTQSEFCAQIEAAGFITRCSQTVHFRYSVFHQFFMACYLSGLSAEQLSIWMDAHRPDKRYDESICYLAGILANHCSQNWILDYLEQNNLRLYVKALAYGRNYAAPEVNINFECACHFFARVLRTYESIIQTHFDNIYHLFDGYSIDDTGKVCIRGDMNLRQRTLSVCMYNGSAEAKTLEAVVSGGRGIYRIEDKTGVSLEFEEHMIRNRREYCYNLDLLALGLDTAREIAVDMIRDQTMRAMDRKSIFDGHIDVLLAEYTESKLRRLRGKRWTGNSESILTLYTGDYDRIIHRLEQLSVTNIEINVCASLTALLRSRVDDVTELLDIRPDLPQTDLALKQRRHTDRLEAAYSDRQLLKKIQRIWTLSDDAIRRITTEIVPALSAVRQPARKIGWVCRGDGFSGIRYIEVKTDEGEDISPILEFREDADRIGASGDLASAADLYDAGQLQRIGKCETNVLRERTAILQRYFGDYVFHSIIYREIKRDFERLFGRR